MGRFGYSLKIEDADEEKIAKAIGRELRISPKSSTEICRVVRKKNVDKAKEFLEDVVVMKRPVPMKKFKGGVAHRKGLEKAYAGKYPVKAASQILKVLESAETNAEDKGLDTERLFVKHISTQRGRVIRGTRPRAFGRASAHNEQTTNIEVVLQER
ncbi:MAG: 50S ribosomal protein L22 [Candidatus Hydrothermarchaeaceae archaeon]